MSSGSSSSEESKGLMLTLVVVNFLLAATSITFGALTFFMNTVP